MKKIVDMFVSRTLILVFWVLVIFGFLFLPSLSRLVYQKKSINLFIWPMMCDGKVIAKFEQETGIKVYINYYESAAELHSKLKATGGVGYDLILPSDYLVELLIQEQLVQKLDRSKLSFFNNLQPYLLNHYYDPTNEYAIPYYMGIWGLGINKDYFGNRLPDADWGLIFDTTRLQYPICMTDEPRQALMLAAHYLSGRIDALQESHHRAAVHDLLVAQKKWVELYTATRVEEVLASGSCPVAIGISSDIWKVMKEYAAIDFIIPKGKLIIGMELFVIPAKTEKTDLVYQFLNFLYRPEIIRANSILYGFCPPIKTVSVGMEKIICLAPDDAQRMEFFRNVVPAAVLQDSWISILSH